MAIDSDIIIIGGGLNGSLMAIVAAKFGFSSIVLDSKENDTSRENHFDGRSYALALSSVRLLKNIDVFDEESKKISNAKWLAQGTIYPDVIESISVKGPSATIKSHHNVGGLPEKMNLKVIEPLKMLFKDEVRKIGASLKMPQEILSRHPFPGPGLGIRILGEVDYESIGLIQEADKIYIDALKKWNLYNKIWQAGSILLPVKSVGVMGDERTYERCVALRPVVSTDGMTADWY